MESYDGALGAALRYLGYKARTEKEMADYLAKRAVPQEIAARVMARLVQYGYIDDDEYAARFAAGRIAMGGARRIAYELRAKGVGEESIRKAVEAIDPHEEVERALRHARTSLAGEADQKARRRAYAALARRGYSAQAIRTALDAAVRELT